MTNSDLEKSARLDELHHQREVAQDVFEAAREAHTATMKKIREEVIGMCQWEPGTKVVWVREHKPFGEDVQIVETPGIIRKCAVSDGMWRKDKWMPAYVVGKINKNGAMNKRLNLTYYPISESDLRLAE